MSILFQWKSAPWMPKFHGGGAQWPSGYAIKNGPKVINKNGQKLIINGTKPAICVVNKTLAPTV